MAVRWNWLFKWLNKIAADLFLIHRVFVVAENSGEKVWIFHALAHEKQRHAVCRLHCFALLSRKKVFANEMFATGNVNSRMGENLRIKQKILILLYYNLM